MKKDAPHYMASGLEEIEQGSTRSAQVIIPYIKDIFNPTSVLDVGYNLGGWLKI